MGYLELNENDRKRYGVPDRVEFEYGQFGIRSIKALKTQTGMTLEYVEHGAFTGKPVTAEDGTETVERDGEAQVALIWLILYNAGHRIPWDDFDIVSDGTRIDLGEGGEEGKAPETDGSSTATTT